jgi:hypothetical protein
VDGGKKAGMAKNHKTTGRSQEGARQRLRGPGWNMPITGLGSVGLFDTIESIREPRRMAPKADQQPKLFVPAPPGKRSP